MRPQKKIVVVTLKKETMESKYVLGIAIAAGVVVVGVGIGLGVYFGREEHENDKNKRLKTPKKSDERDLLRTHLYDLRPLVGRVFPDPFYHDESKGSMWGSTVWSHRTPRVHPTIPAH
jgi:hypothetical protein